MVFALSTLQGSYIDFASQIGYISTIIIYVVSTGIAIHTFTNPSYYRLSYTSFVIYSWFILISIYTISLFWGQFPIMFYRYGQLFAVFILFLSISSIKWTPQITTLIAQSFCVSLIISWLILGTLWPVPNRFLPANPNHVGIMSFLGFMVSWIGYLSVMNYRWQKYLFVFSGLYNLTMLVLSISRSSFLCVIAFFVTFFFYRQISRTKILYPVYFISLISLLTLAIHINYSYYGLGYDLERLLNQYDLHATQKTLLSRYLVWTDSIAIMKTNPLTGLGLGYGRSGIALDGLSSHSIYMEIGSQTGIPGVIAIILLLYALGRSFTMLTNESEFGRFGFAFLSGIIIHQNFESVLTQNNLALAAIIWSILGICTSLHVRNTHRQKFT